MAMTSAEKSARYREKDIDAYRKRKAELAKTPEHRAKRTAYMRKWREQNRDKFNAQARASHQRNKHKHTEKRADYALRKAVGIGVVEKRQMIEGQNGRCKICFKPFKSARQTHVDHCHKTGKVRGILCGSCNTKLGWFEEFSKAITGYLKHGD